MNLYLLKNRSIWLSIVRNFYFNLDKIGNPFAMNGEYLKQYYYHLHCHITRKGEEPL